MSYSSGSRQNLPRDPHADAGPALLGLAALALVIFLFTSAAAVFAASLTAGFAVLVVLGVAVLLAIPLYREQGWKSLSLVLLILTALWAALGGWIVFKNHWLAFTPTAWVLNGLYCAALVSGAWKAAQGWLKLLAALLAAALVTATALLPRPPGGEGPLDTAEQWSLDVDVVDENDQPLEGALVLCSAVLNWQPEQLLSETSARQTDDEGRIPTWEFDEDPRLKVVICSVWKNADDGNAGYPPEIQFVLAPRGGGEYELHFQLTENPHPDVSFVNLQVSGNYQQAWYTLEFELWAGEPAEAFKSSEGPQPVQRKSWNELRGNGFAVPAEVAAGGLWLRYFYEGPGGEGFVPPYSELRTITIDPVAAGSHRRLQLTIPDRANE